MSSRNPRQGLVLMLGGVGLAGLLALGLPLWPGCVVATVFPDAGTGDGPGGSGGDGLLAGVISFRIAPTDAVLPILDNKPSVLAYKALGKLGDGSERDITAQTTFSISDLRVGLFSGNVFTSASDRGGKTTVTAEAGKLTATTSLTVVYQRRFLALGVPPAVEEEMDKAPVNAGRSPSLAYPPDQVLFPPNLVEMEFQWMAGSGNDLFEISLKNEGTDVRFYTRCNPVGAGCGLVPDVPAWKGLVAAFKGREAATLMVRGTDSASFSGVGSSPTRILRVAEEEIQGGLYYWNATPGNIVRYDFGKAKQKATLYYSAADAQALFCVGCHVMSRDGTRIAVGLDMPAPSPLKVLDVSTRNVISTGAANFMTFSPDNQRIITSDGNSMVLREVATGNALTPNPLVAVGTMPDWSADGSRVVFAAPKVGLPIPFGSPGIGEGSLKMLAHDAAAGTWSGPTDLVPFSGQNNYYPTFSPDDRWVVFNRAAGNSYDAPDASLWIVRADGSGKPLPLTMADGGQNLANSWPKFSPYIQKYRGGKLMWITFSSRRDYGLRVVGQNRAQVWMAAIDPGKSEMAADPSHAGFWLPFQDINTGNHIAQWVKSVVQSDCVEDKDCPGGEFCLKGICEPKGPD